MNTISSLERLSPTEIAGHNPLFVFALEAEAAGEFDDSSTLIVGVGKVSAAYHITRHIYQHRPSLIVNLGSAGSNTFARGEVVCCTSFIQRDMDAQALGFREFQTPFSSEEPVLEYGLHIVGLPTGICGTGDGFEMSHANAAYNVVDMEAYALAAIAKREGIPFICLKYITDGADGGAADDWSIQVHRTAKAFRSILGQ